MGRAVFCCVLLGGGEGLHLVGRLNFPLDMNVFEFFSNNPKAWWALGILFMLLIARKPTLRFFQWRMERKAAEMEMSSYDILRVEITKLNKLLIEEQGENRKLRDMVDDLKKMMSAQSNDNN